MRKLIAALVIVVASLFTIGGTALAAAPIPATQSAFSNEGLFYYYFTFDGHQVSAESAWQVKVAVTTRVWSSVPGGLPEGVDAAASILKTGSQVGNVQINNVKLFASSNALRAQNLTPHNSNGQSLASSDTPNICVSPFGSGSYYGQVTVSWRYGVQGNLLTGTFNSALGSSRFATIAC